MSSPAKSARQPAQRRQKTTIQISLRLVERRMHERGVSRADLERSLVREGEASGRLNRLWSGDGGIGISKAVRLARVLGSKVEDLVEEVAA